MKKIIVIVMIIVSVSASHAEESDTSTCSPYLNADLVSRYIWRGVLLSESPAIQPVFGVSLGDFSIGSWASYTFSPQQFQEVDFYLTYDYSIFSFTLNDYFSPLDTLAVSNNYLNYKDNSTLHTLEAMVTISDIASVPVYLTAASFFYGNDKDSNGKNYYSAYLELGYKFNIQDFECTVFGALTPYKGYYASKAAFVNTGITATKKVMMTSELSIPFKGTLALNPNAGNIFFVFAITL